MNIRGFQGINNVKDPLSLRAGELVAADNVYVDDDRVLNRRDPFTQVLPGDAHSLFAHGELCLYRSGTSLMRLYPDLTTALVAAGFETGRRMYFVENAGRIYFGDGLRNGSYDDGMLRSWGVPTPEHNALAEVSTGNLPAGAYLFSIVYIRIDGEEGGSAPIQRIDVPDNGAVVLTGWPMPVEPDVIGVAAYVSQPNGEELYRAAYVPLGAPEILVGTTNVFGAPLITEQVVPPPLGLMVGVHNGQMFNVLDNFLFYSAPYKPDWFDLYKRMVPFPEVITNAASAGTGMWVTTTKSVYWLQGGDIDAAGFNQVGQFGGHPGSLVVIEHGTRTQNGAIASQTYAVSTDDGFYTLQPDGSAVGLTTDRYVAARTEFSSVAHPQPNTNLIYLFPQ